MSNKPFQTAPRLRTCRIENFKAIRDSKTIRLSPLTVFIGNNGSGKSSIVEAMQTYRDIVMDGVDKAINRRGTFEQLHNLAVPHEKRILESQNAKYPSMEYLSNPICFTYSAADIPESQGWIPPIFSARWNMAVAADPAGNKLFILGEEAKAKVLGEKSAVYVHRIPGWDKMKASSRIIEIPEFPSDRSFMIYFRSFEHFQISLGAYVYSWQFVHLNHENMGRPRPVGRASSLRNQNLILLNPDGSNIAEYLFEIRERDLDAFEGIIEAVQYILPYLQDLQPSFTEEMNRNIFLRMKENDFDVPGWLLSTGTLRIVALLALLRNPNPPPLIVIEEIENGLDPRTIHLLMEEIRIAVDSGRTQVIATTHSPYLLNLLNLSEVVLVERNETGQPVFWHPKGDAEAEDWAERFSTGEIYTMDRLHPPKKEKR